MINFHTSPLEYHKIIPIGVLRIDFLDYVFGAIGNFLCMCKNDVFESFYTKFKDKMIYNVL